jgi:hypothetical protein
MRWGRHVSTVRKERHDILRYARSESPLNVTLLEYGAQETSSAALPQSGSMAMRTRSSLERGETLVLSAF